MSGNAWDGLNRRRFPRVSYPCLITIHHADGEQEAILTHTENVGIGGVGVILKQNLKVFSSVKVEIDLLDTEEHIRCDGKIVWVIRRRSDEKKKPLFYDIGIEFDQIGQDDFRRVEDIVNRLVKHEQ